MTTPPPASPTAHWEPSKYLDDPDKYRHRLASGNGHRFALILLNQPIHIQRRLFDNLWENATYRFCADGGANRLYDFLKTDEERSRYLPDYVRGDLDSLHDHVKEYYQSKGVPCERVDDQESTDFMKCVELARSHDSKVPTTSNGFKSESNPADKASNMDDRVGIVALGGTGGRFDQVMSGVHHLFLLQSERHAVILSEASIITILGPGKHEIDCNLEIEGPTCGIIPVGSSECAITTSGLRWDIAFDEMATSFGHRISSSNVLREPKVTVETNVPVVWTTEIRDYESS
ncbi:cAMP-dependent protein kinase subunit [Lunasporangiospora selenospora]|uniref:Thiamine pyrophosphokinase n=1 Tax=Lunasporangiospora selenospora TaxID=979761 RepID=A0A9P6FWF6_9FUNG|nr:cAMP-dependent protein kinase subunit [Lunasporangiospora selenospora]